MTYKIIQEDGKDVLEETISVERKQTYDKQWLIDEIARLQEILNQFPKN